jgi:uracil-DNA glycosylase
VETHTMTRTDVEARLAELARAVEACRACPLGGQRTRAVFGVGNPQADLMFVGEAPGFHEDKQGEPFVGAAGQLLTKLLRERVGLDRSDVYIANTLKCRPPGNRDPLPDEIEACRPHLRQQLKLIRPRVVVTLGNFASRLLLNTQTGITRLRGQRYPFGWAVLIPTFHPAAALRGGAAMRGLEADLDEVRRVLDELPAPTPPDPQQLGLFETTAL